MMEKSAAPATDFLKFLASLPGSIFRGARATGGATGAWPFLRSLGEETFSTLGRGLRRNPLIYGAAGTGLAGLLGYNLLKSPAEQAGYLERLGKFYEKSKKKMKHAYPGTTESNPLYWLGKGTREFGINPILKPLVGSIHAGPVTAGAMGGIGGAGIGGLLGLMRGGVENILPGAVKGSGLGALGMGGLSSFVHRQYSPAGAPSWGFSNSLQNPFKAHQAMLEKYSSVKSAFSDQGYMAPTFGAQFGSGYRPSGSIRPSRPDIVQNIYRQPSLILSLRQKQQLSHEIQGLSPYQMRRLQTLLRGVTGAGVAFVIAKYLLSLGKKSTIISMILGGMMGAMTGRKGPPTNQFGQPFQPFGQQSIYNTI